LVRSTSRIEPARGQNGGSAARDAGADRPAVAAAAQAEQPQVVTYATAWCPYCRQAREFFARHRIVYVEQDVERDQIAPLEHRNLGGGGVPTIVVGKKAIHGYREERLTQLLGPWME
jgi:glutaredoxin